MMAQIPSGLQALMQASQVLQQEASPVAPGPQGPQPTVASRIAQQIEQAPSMQMMGEQAGIAGAIQNQQVARNQQMAQDPRAVAQMAAQMLGIAQNPMNMQFREGGIIGFAEGDMISDPNIPTPYTETKPEVSEEMLRQMTLPELQRYNRTGEVPPRLLPAPPERPMTAEQMMFGGLEREAPEAMSFEQMIPPGLGARPVVPVQATQMPTTEKEPQIVRADETVDTRAADKIAGIAQALQRPLTSPPATIRSLPDIMQEARGQLPPELRESFRNVQERQKEELALRQARPDLEKEAAEALTRADTERKRLLELKRSSDTFTRLNALFSSLYTRGNEVEAADKAMMAREEGAIAAQLAHDQAIIKLKEAKEARKLGDAEKATAFAKEALSFYQTEQGIINKMADMSAKLEGDRATAATAERRIESAERLGVAQILSDATTKLEQARIRAADAKERNALRIKEAEDEAERKKLVDKNREITSVQNFIKDLSSQLAGLETKYGAITKLPAAMQKQPEFAEQAARFNSDRQRLESQIQQAERRLSTLLGNEAPVRSAPSGPRQLYDASGNPIR